MGETKELNIKNQTYYFFNYMIKIKHFHPNLLKIDKKSHKDINIYYIGYIVIKSYGDCENVHSVNPLHLMINSATGYFKEKNGSKYLVFDSGNENNEVLKKYNEVWNGIKNKIETINSGKTSEYYKDFMKIKFNSADNLPLNKTLKLCNMTLVIRFVFEEHGKLYPQVYSDECFYEL